MTSGLRTVIYPVKDRAQAGNEGMRRWAAFALAHRRWVALFILARMREEYDATGSTDRAIIEGMGRTGRLVTSAAQILFLAFAAPASGPSTDLKVMATGLGFGILLDATIVRALLVPSLVSLFGSWNWYLPAGLARILRVQPSQAITKHPLLQPARIDELG